MFSIYCCDIWVSEVRMVNLENSDTLNSCSLLQKYFFQWPAQQHISYYNICLSVSRREHYLEKLFRLKRGESVKIVIYKENLLYCCVICPKKNSGKLDESNRNRRISHCVQTRNCTDWSRFRGYRFECLTTRPTQQVLRTGTSNGVKIPHKN
jgi:hypothetical protein